MKGQIVYIADHLESMQQSMQALNSFKMHAHWDVDTVPGITPSNVKKQKEFNWPIKTNSRLLDFKRGDEKRYLTKLSCVINHIKFFNKVIEANEPMAFFEHDAICIGPWLNVDFDEYLILNAEYVFRKPNKLALQQFKDYTFPGESGVHSLPDNYRLIYYRDNNWNGSFMVPGTGAYAITPKGARKMLETASKGLDQSDFLLNSYNIHIQYILPSPIKFNKINLSTSYGI